MIQRDVSIARVCLPPHKVSLGERVRVRVRAHVCVCKMVETIFKFLLACPAHICSISSS